MPRKSRVPARKCAHANCYQKPRPQLLLRTTGSCSCVVQNVLAAGTATGIKTYETNEFINLSVVRAEHTEHAQKRNYMRIDCGILLRRICVFVSSSRTFATPATKHHQHSTLLLVINIFFSLCLHRSPSLFVCLCACSLNLLNMRAWNAPGMRSKRRAVRNVREHKTKFLSMFSHQTRGKSHWTRARSCIVQRRTLKFYSMTMFSSIYYIKCKTLWTMRNVKCSPLKRFKNVMAVMCHTHKCHRFVLAQQFIQRSSTEWTIPKDNSAGGVCNLSASPLGAQAQHRPAISSLSRVAFHVTFKIT